MAVSGPASSSESFWNDSHKGMSTDNIKGLVLALSSSFFIGASFIVKKKGLKKAGSSGVRAGNAVFFNHLLCFDIAFCFDSDEFVIRTGGFYGLVRVFASFINLFFIRRRFALINLDFSLAGAGGYSYLYEPLWWVGMITSTFF